MRILATFDSIRRTLSNPQGEKREGFPENRKIPEEKEPKVPNKTLAWQKEHGREKGGQKDP